MDAVRTIIFFILLAMLIDLTWNQCKLSSKICQLEAQLNTVQIQTSVPVVIEHKTPNIKLKGKT